MVGTAPDVRLSKFEMKQIKYLFLRTESKSCAANIQFFKSKEYPLPGGKGFRGHSVSRPVPTTGYVLVAISFTLVLVQYRR